MRSKIIICGRGGSGKDHMRKKYEARGFKYCVSYTSRPKRENEEDGKDYKFVDDKFFEENKELFYEIDDFNGWKYGTLKSDFEASDLFIMTVKGVNGLSHNDRNRSIVIFLNPPPSIIKERLCSRKDADNPSRRIETDNKDFDNFTNFDIEIKNEDF